MDPRLQLRVQRYGWDRAASEYEHYWRDALAPAQKRVLELAALQPGESVLDVAAGTGLVTFPAADLVGKSGFVHATDLSDAMVVELRATIATRKLIQVRADRLNAEEMLAVADGSFDVALCALGLMYVPDPRKALGEMLRALRPRGRAVVAVWGPRAKCGWAEVFPIVEKRVASEVCPMFFQLGGNDALRLTMTMAGFKNVRTEVLDAAICYANGLDACAAAFAAGPVAMAYAHFDELARDEAHREYLESLAGFREGEGYRVPGEFVLGVGEKA